jgi:hypothetical protein
MMQVNTTTHEAPKTRCESAEPGEGYRLVKPFERIQPHDDVWSYLHNRWVPNNARFGQELLPHWRPRRRKVAENYPRFWLNTKIETVYCALSARCQGFIWNSGWSRWSACSPGEPMVDHAKKFSDFYRPLTLEEVEHRNVGPLPGTTKRSTQELYDELIYAVASKYPDETRHQTALRYICEGENRIPLVSGKRKL